VGTGVDGSIDEAAASSRPSGPSAGCGKIATDAFQQYVQHSITVGGVDPIYTNRTYFVWLPAGYDETRAYTTIVLGHGCGGNGTAVLPIQSASQGDAILVGLSAVNQCFVTQIADSPDIPFFDAVLAEIEANYCIDKGHVFMAGFSSGARLTNLIGCARAGIVRGQGTAEGGILAMRPECTGPIAAMMAADTLDASNPIVAIDDAGVDTGSGAARDRVLAANGCSNDSIPWDPAFPDCKIYQGCPPAYPVVWCETTGKGHSDQVPISTTGFWKFWSTLPDP
jgi:polyhydroxybutyrate depolymerase